MTATKVGLKNRLLKGTVSQIFGQAVHIFIRVAEVPLLLAFWGPQLYGEWLMLSAIPAYLAIGDGGFATTACREMTMKSGTGDRVGALAVFQSTWLLLLAVSLAAFVFACVFAALVPLHQWLGFATMTAADTRAVLILLVVHVLIGFQGGLLNGGFWVAGKYPIGMALGAFTQLLEFCGLAVAVLLGGGPVGAASGYVYGRALGTGLVWIGQRRASPWLHHGFSKASLSELRRLTAPAFASLAFPLGNAFNIQGMSLVVGLVLGPAAVAVFTPLRTLSNLATQPRSIINRMIEPEMALAYGAKDGSLFNRLFSKSCQLTFWGCLLAAFVVVTAAYWFFPVWTSGKVAIHWPTFGLLLTGVLINSLWYTALMVPYSTNRHVNIAIIYIFAYGAIPFGLGYLVGNAMGLAGAAVALLVAESAMAVIVIRTALRMTQMTLGKWITILMRPPYDIVSQTAIAMRKHTIVTP